MSDAFDASTVESTPQEGRTVAALAYLGRPARRHCRGDVGEEGRSSQEAALRHRQLMAERGRSAASATYPLQTFIDEPVRSAVQLLLGHSKLESTVRYLGIEVNDALEI